MKKIILFSLSLFSNLVFAQVTLLTWNLCNLGTSKAPETLEFIAQTIQHADIVAIQEVVAGQGGISAVIHLAGLLNKSGENWNYAISLPTTSSVYKTERYAFLWKAKNIDTIGKPWLEERYTVEIDREPFYLTFSYQGKTFTVANYHAITKKKQPETEIKYFKFLPDQYPDQNLIFAGDFNCPQSHTVFNPLKKIGYVSAFTNQKTSLKRECRAEECLASEFDTIFYDSKKINLLAAKPILFYKAFETLEKARQVSDHIPLTITFLPH